MNLIEELGIEKCREILDGAPEDGTHFKLSFGLSIFYLLSSGDGAAPAGLWIDDGDESHWSVSAYKNFELFVAENRFISVEDLRTAIAAYDCNHTDNLSHLTDHCTDIRNHLSPNTKVIER